MCISRPLCCKHRPTPSPPGGQAFFVPSSIPSLLSSQCARRGFQSNAQGEKRAAPRKRIAVEILGQDAAHVLDFQRRTDLRALPHLTGGAQVDEGSSRQRQARGSIEVLRRLVQKLGSRASQRRSEGGPKIEFVPGPVGKLLEVV